MTEIRNKIYELTKSLDSSQFDVDMGILADTLYYRLTIIRLGEEDNNAWWESIILGEVGRRNLEKFFPNTFNSQRYDIAAKIINEKENREISEKVFTTLFNFGYEFETETFKVFISQISKLKEWKDLLGLVEKIVGNEFKESWVREFYDISKIAESKYNNQDIVHVGRIGKTFYSNKESFENAILSFLSIYDLCTKGNVKIPYYTRKMAI